MFHGTELNAELKCSIKAADIKSFDNMKTAEVTSGYVHILHSSGSLFRVSTVLTKLKKPF